MPHLLLLTYKQQDLLIQLPFPCRTTEASRRHPSTSAWGVGKLHREPIPMSRDRPLFGHRTAITVWSQGRSPSRPTPGSPASAKGHWVGPGAQESKVPCRRMEKASGRTRVHLSFPFQKLWLASLKAAGSDAYFPQEHPPLVDGQKAACPAHPGSWFPHAVPRLDHRAVSPVGSSSTCRYCCL